MAAYETYETDTVYDEMMEQQNPTVERVSFCIGLFKLQFWLLVEYFLDIHQKAPETVSPRVMEVVPPAPMKENESGNRNVGIITNDHYFHFFALWMKRPTIAWYIINYFRQMTFSNIFLIQMKILLTAILAVLLLILGGGVALFLKSHLEESGKFCITTSFHSLPNSSCQRYYFNKSPEIFLLIEPTSHRVCNRLLACMLLLELII